MSARTDLRAPGRGARSGRLGELLHRRLVRSRGRFGSSVRYTLDAWLSPLPRVRAEHGRWVPGWTLRLVIAALLVATAVLLGVGTPGALLLSAFGLAVLIRPSARTGSFFCLGVALVWLVLPFDPLSWRAAGLLLTVPAVLALATEIEAVPLPSRVEFRALWPSLRRFLIVELVSQPVVLAAVALRSGGAGTVGYALPVAIAGAAVLAVAGWLLLPRLNR